VGHPRVLRRFGPVGPPLLIALVTLLAASCNPPQRLPQAGWHLAWRAESVFPTSTATTTSCRFDARLTGYGSRVRAEFTSRVGSAGYSIVAASLAIPVTSTGLDVLAGSSQPLTFGAGASVAVLPGHTVLSDPLPLTVQPGTEVAVTVTATAGDAPGKAGRPEPAACGIGQPADVANAAGSAFPQPASVRWLRSLLVEGPPQRSIVALGDSITEGAAPATMGYTRWSDQIADTGAVAANAGVSGGVVNGWGLYGSPSGTDRVRAVLAEPDVTDLVVLLGTNDLTAGSAAGPVLDGLSNILAQAQARGVHVWMGTITPRSSLPWSTFQEQQREFINAILRSSWLTSRGGSLIDTDFAVRDPRSPTHLLPLFDSGDHLHPNVAGERALGQAVLARLGRITLPVVSPPPPLPQPTTSPSPSP
jgi:lysophospholipase L1-like esterase